VQVKKIFILQPNEGWIVDRMAEEFRVGNPDIVVADPCQADVIWLLAEWAFDQLPYDLLRQKKVLTTCHHYVPEKFDPVWFARLEAITDVFHVFNGLTLDFIRPLTQKPIYYVNYWANQQIWRHTGTKEELRLKYELSPKTFIVASFQRDTEGAGIPLGIYLPKTEKGTDLLADYIEQLHPPHPTLHVLLAGWRRQYIIARLEAAHIPYTYFERPSLETINELYQCCDLYPVAARYEGGPQSLIECGLLGIPCVSRHVGIANLVLPPSAVNNDLSRATPAVPDVEAWKIPGGFEQYRNLLQVI
jgi:glycosyltransferase involved in cell wall biosynthesis